MLKKFAALLLSAVMVVSGFAGCSGKGKNPDTANGGNKTGEATNKASEEVYKYSLASYFVAPPDDNAEMKKYWEDKFNVKFELVYLEPAKYYDLLNLRIASNQIPDIINMQGSLSKVMEYKSQGVLGGWEEKFLREKAPVMAKHIDEKIGAEAWKLSKIDGKMYSIPGMSFAGQFGNPAVWRDDWLKNVGIKEIPKKLEDVEKAFYSFRNNDPDKNGKKDTYALSNTGFTFVYGAYGVPQKMWLEDKSSNLVYTCVDPRTKDALRTLSKWYKDELIDPEFVTGENKGGYWALSQTFTDGRIGFSAMGDYSHWQDPKLWDLGQAPFANSELLKKTIPNATFAHGYPFIGPNGDRGTARNSVSFSAGFSQACVENKGKFEKLLKMIQVWSGYENVEDALTQRFGVKGKTWDYDDKKVPVPKEGYKTPADQSKIGAMTTFYWASNMDYEAAMFPVLSNWAKELYSDKDRYVTYSNKAPIGLPSAKKYSADLEKIIDEGFIEIITGAKDINYFDEIVAKWKKSGGDQLTKEANEWYKSSK